MSFDHDKVVVPPHPSRTHLVSSPWLTVRHSDTQRVIIYPAYVNKKLTVAEGRKIPTSKGE